MGRPNRYSPGVREQAARIVLEHHDKCASHWALLKSDDHIRPTDFEPL